MHAIQLTDLPAAWARCRIEVKGDTLQPVAPFTPYNLFDFYFPAGKAREREQRSLYFEFLRVDASKSESIVDFCERFGVLRILDDGKALSIVDSFEQETDPEELAKYPRWSLGAARLARFGDRPADPGGYCALTVGEFRTAQTRLRQAVSWAQASQAAPSRAEAVKARFNLRQLVNSKLLWVYPRLVWDEQQTRWVSGWDIRSLEAAMYLMLHLDLQDPGRIRTCPWCQTLFLGDARTRFCSLRCQNARNVSQFREKALRPSGKRAARSSPQGGPRKRKPRRKTKR
jgi:hypothetical protein